jgi:hypothetical protein
MRKFGAYLAPRKQEALANGDTSNPILHPYFFHKVISFGMHYSTIVEDSPPMVLLHARHIQGFWEELANIHQGNNYDLKVQSMVFLIAGCMFVRFPRLAGFYLWKACKMANAAEMRFVPKYGHPPEYSDEVHEKSTVLSQLIWMESYLFLTCDGAKPKLTARIEEEFRNQLPVSLLGVVCNVSCTEVSCRRSIRCCFVCARWPFVPRGFCLLGTWCCCLRSFVGQVDRPNAPHTMGCTS